MCLVLFTARSWRASWPQTIFLSGELPPFTMRTGRGIRGCLYALVVAMGLAAAVMFGFATVVAKRWPPRTPPATGIAWQAGLGLIPVGGLALFETADWTRVTPVGWACVAYVATIPMTVAYLVWFRALRLVPAPVAAKRYWSRRWSAYWDRLRCWGRPWSRGSGPRWGSH